VTKKGIAIPHHGDAFNLLIDIYDSKAYNDGINLRSQEGKTMANTGRRVYQSGEIVILKDGSIVRIIMGMEFDGVMWYSVETLRDHGTFEITEDEINDL